MLALYSYEALKAFNPAIPYQEPFLGAHKGHKKDVLKRFSNTSYLISMFMFALIQVAIGQPLSILQTIRLEAFAYLLVYLCVLSMPKHSVKALIAVKAFSGFITSLNYATEQYITLTFGTDLKQRGKTIARMHVMRNISHLASAFYGEQLVRYSRHFLYPMYTSTIAGAGMFFLSFLLQDVEKSHAGSKPVENRWSILSDTEVLRWVICCIASYYIMKCIASFATTQYMNVDKGSFSLNVGFPPMRWIVKGYDAVFRPKVTEETYEAVEEYATVSLGFIDVFVRLSGIVAYELSHYMLFLSSRTVSFEVLAVATSCVYLFTALRPVWSKVLMHVVAVFCLALLNVCTKNSTVQILTKSYASSQKELSRFLLVFTNSVSLLISALQSIYIIAKRPRVYSIFVVTFSLSVIMALSVLGLDILLRSKGAK